MFERVSAFFDRFWVVERSSLLAAEEIDHPIPGHTKKPGSYMPYGLHETVGLKEFVEDVLKNIFGFAGVGYVLANKTAKPRLVSLQCFGDELVLLDNRPPPRHLFPLHLTTRGQSNY